MVFGVTQQLLLQAEEPPTRWMRTDVFLLEQVLVLYVVLVLQMVIVGKVLSAESEQF